MDSKDLFERYLQAIGKYLPWQRQGDIVAELRANLEAQREERESELGRRLTEGEMIDWLKELGPPLRMAARYQPPRYVIGPAVFPMYIHILRLVALWLTVGYAISVLIRVIVEPHQPQWVAMQIAHYPGILITAAAWVTLVFVVFEYLSERHPEMFPDFLTSATCWSPTTLPPLDQEPPAGTKPRSLPGALAELIVQFCLVIWLLLIPNYPVLLLGPGAAYLQHSPVRLAPISVAFYWSLVVFGLIQLCWQASNFLRGNWRMHSRTHHLVTKALGIVPIAILAFAPGHRYLELNPFEAGRLPAGLNPATLNRDIFGGVLVILAITVIQLAWDVWKTRPSARAARLRMVF